MEIAREVEDGEFWLPSEFLAGDFHLGERKDRWGGAVRLHELPAVFGFSPESAAVESDGEDYLAALTRQMAHYFVLDDDKAAAPPMSGGNPKTRAMAAAAPESTLYSMEQLLAASRNESLLIPARRPSPPSSAPTKGQTAGYYANRALTQRQLQAAQFHYLRRRQLLKQQQQQQQQLSATLWGKQSRARGAAAGGDGGGDRQVGLSPTAWPPHQKPPPGSGMRAVFAAGGGTKRESTGTGVFLPRTPVTASVPHKKPGCSTVVLPAKVIQALNLNLEELRARPPSEGGFVLDHAEALAGRSNASARPHGYHRQQLQPAMPANEIHHHLPHEWTY